MNKKNIWIIAVVIFVGVSVYFALNWQRSSSSQEITNFEECAKLYPVMESYPRQCGTPGGKHFTE